MNDRNGHKMTYYLSILVIELQPICYNLLKEFFDGTIVSKMLFPFSKPSSKKKNNQKIFSKIFVLNQNDRKKISLKKKHAKIFADEELWK